MSIEAARTARELQMLEGLVDCAHALGMAVGAAAKAETDVRASLARVEIFQKCFLAVRMGIRLCMSLRAGRSVSISAHAAAVERPEALEHDPAEHDPSEREALERPDPLERERDRDYEPVSLPTFLRTLGVVARDAARLDDRLPPEAKQALPALQGLLAQAQSDPSARPPPGGVAVLARPAPAARRDRLLGSAATALPGLRAPGPRPRPGFS